MLCQSLSLIKRQVGGGGFSLGGGLISAVASQLVTNLFEMRIGQEVRSQRSRSIREWVVIFASLTARLMNQCGGSKKTTYWIGAENAIELRFRNARFGQVPLRANMKMQIKMY